MASISRWDRAGLPKSPAPFRVVKCTPLPSFRGLNAGVLAAAAGAAVLRWDFFVLSRFPTNLIRGTRPCSWEEASLGAAALPAGALTAGAAGAEGEAAAAAEASTSIS